MPKSKKRKTAGKHQPTAPIVARRPPPEFLEGLKRLKEYAAAVDISGAKAAPRLLSLVFCDFSNITNDGKINLLGIFDRIFVHPEIRKSPPFVLYGRTAEAFEDNLWVRVFDPDNEPHVEIKIDHVALKPDEDRLPDSPNQFQFAIPLQMAFPKTGTYWFDISYRNFSLGGAGLVIDFRKIQENERGTNTYL